ncbi:DUF2812 domain-containing protein [Thermoactinomyces sp. DSM 45892]|uniref:DUF2812 domain-containing protein n=1 Tax=Thermoactinomyces sp. DSM 45892 TaxID=1882753 RepID=UPI000AFC6226|nr:DUF2812 domain-containing protein [Thermoactinomyces sp. DSM 45892]
MKKFKMFIDIHKEEAWLNEQLKKGYELVKRSSLTGVYHFKKTTNPNQVIKLDVQNGMSKEKYNTYVDLHEEFGWRRVANSRHHYIHYWIKEKDGHDELFSDVQSSGAMLKRIANYYLLWFVVFLAVSTSGNVYLNPMDAYLTPGLWGKQGSAFIKALLFETPFALMRCAPVWFCIIMTMVFTFKYKKCLKQENTFAE